MIIINIIKLIQHYLVEGGEKSPPTRRLMSEKADNKTDVYLAEGYKWNC